MDKNIFIIAEIAQAHDGSLGILHSYIDAMAKSGVDALKFQTHIAEAESSIYEPFRINFSYEDKTRYDYWKRMEFTQEQWIGIKQHCDDVGIEFISSPFSNKAVDLLELLDVKRYKVGSGEVNNFLLLEKIAQTKKPVILSSGMSSFNELDKAVKYLQNAGVDDITIMQCTTSYPTQSKDLGLNVIQQMSKRYSCNIGYSDHSGEVAPLIASVAMGAVMVEFHITFSKSMFGPDATSSLTIEQSYEAIKSIRIIQESLANPVDKNDTQKYKTLKNIFEKSLAVNKELKKAVKISFDDLEAKKPFGYGIDAKEYKNIIGKELCVDKQAWDFLEYEDFV